MPMKRLSIIAAAALPLVLACAASANQGPAPDEIHAERLEARTNMDLGMEALVPESPWSNAGDAKPIEVAARRPRGNQSSIYSW